MSSKGPRGKYLKSRPYKGKCENCSKETKDVYQYIDGNNYSITYYAPYLCKECYIKQYGRN